MKKLKYLLLPLFILCLIFAGCETNNQLRVASISNITAAGSEDFAIRINYQEDKRLENKEFDVQVRCDTSDVKLTFWKENEQKVTSNIAVKERWISLTSLKSDSAGLSGNETFKKLKDAVDESYIFNVSKSCKLIFRVVAGEATENSAKTGQILANFEAVSDDFVLECKLK